MQSNAHLEAIEKYLAEEKQRLSVPEPSHETAVQPETEQTEPETEQAESSKKVTLNLVLFFVTLPPRKSHVFVCCSASVKRMKVVSSQQRQRRCRRERYRHIFVCLRLYRFYCVTERLKE